MVSLRASTASTSRIASPSRGLAALLVGLPIVPRQRVHRRLGREQRNVVVLRIIARDGQHRVGKGAVEIGALGIGVGRIALGQRHDQRPLGRRDLGRQLLRLGDRLQRQCVGVGRHRRVDVGPMGQRFAPPAHGAIGIEPLRLAEGGDRRGMVEAVGEAHALVEIALRLGARGGDREVDLAEPVIEPNAGRLAAPDDGRDHRQLSRIASALAAAAQAGHPGRWVEQASC